MEFRYLHNNAEYLVRLDVQPDGRYVARIGEITYHVEIQQAQRGQFNLMVDGKTWRAYAVSPSQRGAQLSYVALLGHTAQVYELEKVTATARRTRRGVNSGNLSAQMPGQVLDVLVSEGDAVKAGQSLMILEAMKMESRVAAPHNGVITKILARKGDTVDRGQQLAEIRATDSE